MIEFIHRAEDRGKFQNQWLESYHSFSFGHYYDETRMGFGKLRVLNDDVVEAGQGFDTHPHKNMEIISIPLQGSLKHQDSMGNIHTIEAGEVQLMSAGTGVSHSEYNASKSERCNFLQIWIVPKVQATTPRYFQRRIDYRPDEFSLVVAPTGEMPIHQDTCLSLGKFREGNYHYQGQGAGNKVYFFVISGVVQLEQETLSTRDAAGIIIDSSLSFHVLNDAHVLVVESP